MVFSFYSYSAGFGFLGGLPLLFLSSTMGNIKPVICPPPEEFAPMRLRYEENAAED